MKVGKKLQKRLESRIKGYEEILTNPKNSKNAGAFTRPGSRSSKGK
jgi:hypothetical protein